MSRLTLYAFSKGAKYNIASQLKGTSPCNFESKGIKLKKGKVFKVAMTYEILFLWVHPCSNKGKQDADNLANAQFTTKKKNIITWFSMLVLFHRFFFICLTSFLVL